VPPTRSPVASSWIVTWFVCLFMCLRMVVGGDMGRHRGHTGPDVPHAPTHTHKHTNQSTTCGEATRDRDGGTRLDRPRISFMVDIISPFVRIIRAPATGAARSLVMARELTGPHKSHISRAVLEVRKGVRWAQGLNHWWLSSGLCDDSSAVKEATGVRANREVEANLRQLLGSKGDGSRSVVRVHGAKVPKSQPSENVMA
jgi:hypothetical protein